MLPAAYRRVLTVPRVRVSVSLMFAVRLPLAGMGVLLTLHVVTQLGRGYGEAGLVGTATTVGGACGAPVVGRLLDRYGLRRIVVVCGSLSAAFWSTFPHVPYPVIVVLAFPAGLATLPVGSLARQFLAALLPREQHRAAFSLDTISAEASFVVGPTIGVLVSTTVSSTAALTGIGVWLAVTAIVLYIADLPIRGAAESAGGPAGDRGSVRSLFSGRLVAAFMICTGALFTLVGTELSLVAALQNNGETPWTGVVIAVMSLASVAGGVVHGAIRRSLPQAVLALVMGLLLFPVGLFDHTWWVLALALIPMNLLCTPTLAAGVEAVSHLAPPEVRGTAMGIQDAACRLGMALGTPLVGLVLDQTSAAVGFVVAGAGSVLAAGSVLFLRRTHAGTRRWTRPAETTAPH